MQQQPDPQNFFQLSAGESRLLRAKAGSTLISSAGALSVTGAPLWLGEQVFRSNTKLAPGQHHLIEQEGWLTLTAGPQGDAVGWMCPPQALSLVRALREAGSRRLQRYARIARIAGIRRHPAKPGSLG